MVSVYKKSEELNNLRNNAVHDALDTDSASAENWLEKVQPHLDEVRIHIALVL